MGRIYFLIGICIGIVLYGCKPKEVSLVPETEERLFRQAQQFLREGRSSDAFRAFSGLLEKRKQSPETHLELGRLYLSLHNDPVFAIYHFRQYLLLEPKGKWASVALQMIESAKRDFARHLPLGDRDHESVEYLNLMEVLKQLRRENAQLKEQLAGLMTREKRETETLVRSGESLVEVRSNREDVYVVKEGDTLSKISFKIYGTSQKWPQLFEANRDTLLSPKNLRVGMKLKIPDLN
ncbi:MAG: LysM peptidoglycan-binding domain-containing protein [Puniceicoccales bacterium]|jgi:hypothetical protein|nr:LysM peptidoglycan-binding domain-containing protein [Puniceicoccales bacterium]